MTLMPTALAGADAEPLTECGAVGCAGAPAGWPAAAGCESVVSAGTIEAGATGAVTDVGAIVILAQAISSAS
jgi:hypothetical protein